jgi:transcriptional regulator with GAF, ATPase, and Fis domain
MPRAALDVEADFDARRRDQVVAELGRAGVDLSAKSSRNGYLPLVLLTKRIDAEHCNRLTPHSRKQRRVILLSLNDSAGAVALIWQLIAAGASDVLTWDRSGHTAEQVAARLARWEAIDDLVSNAKEAHRVIGSSAALLGVLRRLAEAAHFTDDPILITGETGTGKEVTARLVHALDAKRNRRPLTIVDAGAIVPTLSGSEFFGHERGAFTGAAAARDGALALAKGGILFLDEVGELPADMQVQLLRVLQEKKYKRVGGNKWEETDFRLVAATNRDLRADVEAGRFRRDLYYRLAVWTIDLPPLRERSEDILPLAEHFLSGNDDEPPILAPEVRAYLIGRDYPGNIRDLQQLCRQIRGRHAGGRIYTAGDLPEPLVDDSMGDWREGPFASGIRRALESQATLREITAAAADTAVQLTLEGRAASTASAAESLQVTQRALQMRLRKITAGSIG